MLKRKGQLGKLYRLEGKIVKVRMELDLKKEKIELLTSQHNYAKLTDLE